MNRFSIQVVRPWAVLVLVSTGVSQNSQTLRPGLPGTGWLYPQSRPRLAPSAFSYPDRSCTGPGGGFGAGACPHAASITSATANGIARGIQ